MCKYNCYWLLAIFLMVSSSPAKATTSDDCPKDLGSELPIALTKNFYSSHGVASFVKMNSANDSAPMVAAILAPSWLFQPICGNTSDYQPQFRSLSIWKFTGGKWKNIGQNESVVWPADTVGQVTVELSVKGGTLMLYQYSTFQRASFSDTLTFRYEPKKEAFRTIGWESTSKYLGMYGGGPFDTLEGFEAKLRQNPNITDFEGYEGSVNYLTGLGWKKTYEFEKVPKFLHLSVPMSPILLQHLKNDSPFENKSAVAEASWAPSYNCALADTNTELQICSSRKLSNVDNKLTRLYKHALDHASDKQSFIGEQNAWRNSMRDRCIKDEECILNTYKIRMKQLSQLGVRRAQGSK